MCRGNRGCVRQAMSERDASVYLSKTQRNRQGEGRVDSNGDGCVWINLSPSPTHMYSTTCLLLVEWLLQRQAGRQTERERCVEVSGGEEDADSSDTLLIPHHIILLTG